ncbi:uncharacterized protein LOC132282748 isoform X1 [Cornus florida]|uniref:uncharacterized protein LOC132282748 isoform X1 n=1 Tax=Cornus florida TaxID=4283 RepID=UPI00289A72C8|nr:uncharacterized protein LOC132282748 isoform X1 [Cornus florida]XP_059640505.1 uncharacterized protein LOC132282748 isoform X1 [Cornus florida]XP_059640506.1 uncharacterized protein LOC132282748 isoform X1 [Cornus florida]
MDFRWFSTNYSVNLCAKSVITLLPVAAGELEPNHECNPMQWSPEDFESKLQELVKQTYQRGFKAAADFGYQKESPEVLVHGAMSSAFLTIAQAMSDRSRVCIKKCCPYWRETGAMISNNPLCLFHVRFKIHKLTTLNAGLWQEIHSTYLYFYR